MEVITEKVETKSRTFYFPFSSGVVRLKGEPQTADVPPNVTMACVYHITFDSFYVLTSNSWVASALPLSVKRI